MRINEQTLMIITVFKGSISLFSCKIQKKNHFFKLIIIKCSSRDVFNESHVGWNARAAVLFQHDTDLNLFVLFDTKSSL